MATRGYIIIDDGVFLAHYNHWDSYVEGLGVQLYEDVKKLLEEGFGPENLRKADLLPQDLEGFTRQEKEQILKKALLHYERLLEAGVVRKLSEQAEFADGLEMFTPYWMFHDLMGDIYTQLKNGILLAKAFTDLSLIDFGWIEHVYIVKFLGDGKAKIYHGPVVLVEGKLNVARALTALAETFKTTRLVVQQLPDSEWADAFVVVNEVLVPDEELNIEEWRERTDRARSTIKEILKENLMAESK